jgi:hypothetical protein
MTLCRSMHEPGAAKAHRRTAAVPWLVLGSRPRFSQAFASQTQFAGRSRPQADGLAPDGSHA